MQEKEFGRRDRYEKEDRRHKREFKRGKKMVSDQHVWRYRAGRHADYDI